jgi:hypothetical protein
MVEFLKISSVSGAIAVSVVDADIGDPDDIVQCIY